MDEPETNKYDGISHVPCPVTLCPTSGISFNIYQVVHVQKKTQNTAWIMREEMLKYIFLNHRTQVEQSHLSWYSWVLLMFCQIPSDLSDETSSCLGHSCFPETFPESSDDKKEKAFIDCFLRLFYFCLWVKRVVFSLVLEEGTLVLNIFNRSLLSPPFSIIINFFLRKVLFGLIKIE